MSVMEVDLHKLKINDPFLGQYQQLVRDVVIPYQWDALNDRIEEADPSHAIENFRIAAGHNAGAFTRTLFAAGNTHAGKVELFFLQVRNPAQCIGEMGVAAVYNNISRLHQGQ